MASQMAALQLGLRNGGEHVDGEVQVQGRSTAALLIFFAAALLLVLFCGYLRWAFHRLRLRRQPPPPAATAGLPIESMIQSFPVLLYRCACPGEEEGQCSICLGCFVEGEKVKVLPGCSHSFHPHCVDAWLRTHPSCPLCRALLGREATAAAV